MVPFILHFRPGGVDAARYSAHYILNSGKSLALVPGGGLLCHAELLAPLTVTLGSNGGIVLQQHKRYRVPEETYWIRSTGS